MSYILDALRKAESERQLGHVPGVHAQVVPVASGKPLVGWIIVFLLVLIAVLLAWRMLVPAVPKAVGTPAAATSTVAVAPAASPSSAISPPASPVQGAALPLVDSVAVPAQATRQASASAKAQIPQARPDLPSAGTNPMAAAQTKPTGAAAAVAPASASPSTSPSTPPGASASVAAAVVKAPAAASLAPAETDADEALPLLAQLPDVIQREVPAIAVKGYMYSKNPADRVLIVGSNFHHEGDDFPNGVRLEKLLPKAAVFSYKGFRYRVAY